jgi:hypothetical protein
LDEEDQEKDLPPWLKPWTYLKPSLQEDPSITIEPADREKLTLDGPHMISLTQLDKYHAWKNLLDPMNEDYPTDSVFYMVRKLKNVETSEALRDASWLLRTFERNLKIQKSLKVLKTRLNVLSSLLAVQSPKSPHLYNPKLQMLKESIHSDRDWFLESFFKPELNDLRLALRDNIIFWQSFHGILPPDVLQGALNPPVDGPTFMNFKQDLLQRLSQDQEPFVSTLLQRNKDLTQQAQEQLTLYRLLEKFEPSKVSETLENSKLVEITPETRSLYFKHSKLLPPLDSLLDSSSISLNHETLNRIKEIEGDEGQDVEFKLLEETELPEWVDAPKHLEERVETDENKKDE